MKGCIECVREMHLEGCSSRCEMAEERGLEIDLDCPNPKQMLVAALVGDEGEASTANPVAEEGGAGAGEDGVDGSAK